MNLREFLKKCWEGYCEITPDAKRIHDLLGARGDQIINDHVAFRTFNLPGITRLELGAVFENWGYERKDDMDFIEKKLRATYWLHPDASLPKIFISELLLEKVSLELRSQIKRLVGDQAREMSPEALLRPFWNPPTFSDYESFYLESEYAAWTAAFGIRVNHFTVFFNHLRSFSSLQELNSFLTANGFALNTAGGVVKGTPNEGLEQSSTLAQKIDWKFAGGEKRAVMSCYYEFARRYPLPSGELFHGFIPKSADKIFESTFEKK